MRTLIDGGHVAIGVLVLLKQLRVTVVRAKAGIPIVENELGHARGSRTRDV